MSHAEQRLQETFREIARRHATDSVWRKCARRLPGRYLLAMALGAALALLLSG